MPKTTDDSSVVPLPTLKHQARTLAVHVKIASLLMLCGVKYWEAA